MNKRTITFLGFIFFICIPFFAEYNRSGIVDSSEIRSALVESWFEAPLSSVRMNKPEVRTNCIGSKFQIRLEEAETYFNIIVAPYMKMEVDVYSDKGKSTEIQDVYPADAPGSFVLVRDKKTGKPLRIRFYFASDSEVFVQFSPINNFAYADFIFYNCYSSKNVPTGLPFERFYTASFDDIQKWTKTVLPWQYTDIHKEDYHASVQMVEVIREKLSSFLYTDDAIYDENGEPVYISTGKKRKIEESDIDKISVNGAGFLKWIADGIVEPLSGGCLKRLPLINETVQYKDCGFQGILSESYNISFSLDWIRNLSSAIFSVRSKKMYLYNESGVDVSIEPFSFELTDKGVEGAVCFIQNSGYSVKKLKPLLYILASSEPESFYFMAIRETDRKSPEIKVFNDCAVVFPYFDSDGNFKFIIFKDGVEVSYDDFYSRYCKDYVFLTRSRCTEQFFPR